MFDTNQKLITRLKNSGVLKSSQIEKALLKIDRKYFVPDDLQQHAYSDRPLLLAEGQTISQPTTVVFMLELLDVQPGNKVLDIGAGSGWVSCLMAYLAGEKAKVYAYEINNRVGVMGKKNIEKYSTKKAWGFNPRIRYEVVSAANKWKESAPYDRIHSGAGFNEIPEDLKKCLKVGGALVAPTQDGHINKITRKSEDEFEEERFYGFVFVPFLDN